MTYQKDDYIIDHTDDYQDDGDDNIQLLFIFLWDKNAFCNRKNSTPPAKLKEFWLEAVLLVLVLQS